MKKSILTLLLKPGEKEPTLWDQLWENLTAREYENLDTSSGTLLSIKTVIIGLFLGLCVAIFAAVFNKRVLGGFVRHLLREECLSPEQGKTLPELGLADKLWLRRAVKNNVSLRKVIRCREEEEYYAAQYGEEANTKPRPRYGANAFHINPDEHHFYIPEDMKYMADIKFEKKGNTWFSAIFSVIILLIAMIALLLALPYILNILNDFVGVLNPSDKSNILN